MIKLEPDEAGFGDAAAAEDAAFAEKALDVGGLRGGVGHGGFDGRADEDGTAADRRCGVSRCRCRR